MFSEEEWRALYERVEVWLPIDDIFDPDYQRILSQDHVKKIAKNLNPLSFGRIRVHRRQGTAIYACADGGHRLKALLNAGYTGRCVPVVIVSEESTAETEAAQFISDNVTRLSLKSIDLYRAGIIAKQEPWITIAETLGKQGIFLPEKEAKAATKQYAGLISSLSRFYSSYKKAWADYVSYHAVFFAKVLWGNNYAEMKQERILGIGAALYEAVGILEKDKSLPLADLTKRFKKGGWWFVEKQVDDIRREALRGGTTIKMSHGELIGCAILRLWRMEMRYIKSPPTDSK